MGKSIRDGHLSTGSVVVALVVIGFLVTHRVPDRVSTKFAVYDETRYLCTRAAKKLQPMGAGVVGPNAVMAWPDADGLTEYRPDVGQVIRNDIVRCLVLESVT